MQKSFNHALASSIKYIQTNQDFWDCFIEKIYQFYDVRIMSKSLKVNNCFNQVKLKTIVEGYKSQRSEIVINHFMVHTLPW